MTIDPAAATHIQSMATTASRRRHDPIKASKQPRRLPVPRHEETGREDETTRGEPGKGEARGSREHRRGVSKQVAETDGIADDIPMTSQERARHGQRGQAER